MKTFITIMSFIVGALFALSGFLISANHNETASNYLEAGLAVTGVTIPIILIDAAYKFFNRRYVRRPSGISSTPPLTTSITKTEKFKFGAYWDTDLNALCPVCQTPLVLSRDKLMYRIDGGVPLPLPEPHCFKCNKLISLHDDDGNHLTLSEAKRLLSSKKPELEIEAQKPLQITITPTPLIEPENKTEPPKFQIDEAPAPFIPDEIDLKILAFLADPKQQHKYAIEIANVLRLHQTLIDHHLDQLLKEHFVSKTRPQRIRPHVYRLTSKGREFAVKNNLLGIEPKPKEPETKTEPPKPQTPKPATFVPDEIDIKILVFIDRPALRNVYVVEIGNKLNLDHALVDSHLKQLDKENYVELSLPDASYGSTVNITQKGKDFLHKPAERKIPFESGRLPPIEEKILILLSDSNVGEYPSSLPDLLDMSQVRTQHHLGNLIARGYIYSNSFNDFGEPVFNLSRKAIDYLVVNDLDK